MPARGVDLDADMVGRCLEKELDVKVTAREGWIKIEGAAENVDRAQADN